MQRLLKRQLKRIYGKSYNFDELSEQEKKLIEVVSLTYEENYKEQKFYEHTVDLSSKELNEKNKALKKVLSSLTEAQRLAHTGSWLYDLNSNTLEWSDELYRIYELEAKKIQPSLKQINQFIHPEDKNIIDANLQQTLKNGEYNQTYRLNFGSEKTKYVHEHREVLVDYKNEAIAVQGIIQDISAQKIAEEELNLYANVFHNIGESIFITDQNNKIIAVNSAFTKNTGYTIDDLKGENPSILSDGTTPHSVYKNMWTELNNKGFWQGELNDRKKSGDTFPKWMSISVSYSTTGEVLHYIASFADISEHKSAQERINYLAHHDALTGLVNRFSLEERLMQSLNTAQRNNQKLAIMYIDMDRFKMINDSMGHSAGDALLIEVAKRLQDSVRKSDIVARIGGDEFVVVLTSIENNLVPAPFARVIKHKLGLPYIINDMEVFSTPSIGISLYPCNGDNAETLMKNADIAMYHAKDRGQNNYQFFTESLNEQANERLKIENDLRFAIENKQFELFYQPQICTNNNYYCGVEALVRWHHPERGLVLPEKFIPIAEETKLIIPLGLWVLKQACIQLKEWRKKYNKQVKMSVNLSAQQLHDRNLDKYIKLLIKKYNIQEGELELELTESTVMEDPEEAIVLLNKIRDLGVKLAIDDFGTGYSSLAYLKPLPIHTLKLDRTFVSDLEINKNDAEISAAALALAHNLGLQVVAEGVETNAQKEFLISHHCEILQGYFFSKPVPVGAVEKVIFN